MSSARRPASEHACRTLLLREVDVAEDFFILRLRRDRADLRRLLERVAHSGGARERQESLDERVVNRAMNQRARARDASLAGRGEDP